jgi:hypothetical protein
LEKIICLDWARKQVEKGKACRCEHKYVTVYAVSRTVKCTICGTELDPFDVLLDLTWGYVPLVPERDEERAMALEIVKRKNRLKKKEEGDKVET